MSRLAHLSGPATPPGVQRIFLATPTYTGNYPDAYVEAMIKTTCLLNEAGIGWEWCRLLRNCHVDDSRNRLVREFMLSSCNELMFLDADVGWSAGEFLGFVRLDRDFVCGVYPYKGDNTEMPLRMEPGKEIWEDKDGLVTCLAAPTGFMRMRRSVIEKMIAAYGHRKYTAGDKANGDTPITLLFERTFGPDPNGGGNRRWGGDYDWCNRWRALGGQIFVDPNLHLSHVGAAEFTGTLADFWDEKHGVARMRRKAQLDRAVKPFLEDLPNAVNDVKALSDLMVAWNNPWAMPPEQSAILGSLALQAPGPTLECGSGLSTLLLAAVAKHRGSHHYALEHDLGWSAYTLVQLRRYGLQKYVNIIPADLKQGDGGEWYDIPPDTLPESIGLLLVDGPPREHDLGVRGQAIPALKDRFAPGAYVFVDDVDSLGFGVVLENWSKLLDCSFEVLTGGTRKFAVARTPAKQVEAALSAAS